MEKKQWVQHISGQGEKWEVVVDNAGNAYQWWVRSGPAPCGWHYLPKSEYVLCDPPEVWRDVTEAVKIDEYFAGGKLYVALYHQQENSCLNVLYKDHGCYRLRKVGLWKQAEAHGTYESQPAFIVEQKVS